MSKNKTNRNRTRNSRIVFYLNDNEKNQLEQKMELAGIKNRELFIRKLILDGYIVNVDMKPTTGLMRLIKNAVSNINQVAKRANETGSAYEQDVLDLRAEIDRFIPLAVEAHKNTVKLRGL